MYLFFFFVILDFILSAFFCIGSLTAVVRWVSAENSRFQPIHITSRSRTRTTRDWCSLPFLQSSCIYQYISATSRALSNVYTLHCLYKYCRFMRFPSQSRLCFYIGYPLRNVTPSHNWPGPSVILTMISLFTTSNITYNN